MPIPQDNTALRQAALAEFQRRQGFYAPPQMQTAPVEEEEERKPSGFRKALGNTLGAISSGERFADWIGDQAGKVIPAFRGRESGKRILGRGDYVGLEDIPVIGKVAAFGADVAGSPLTVATGGFGGPAAAALRGAGPVGRVAAKLVEPVGNTFGKRVGAEVATAGGARLAADAADEAGLPEPLVIGAGLAGGLLGLKTVGNVASAATKNVGGYTTDQVAEMVQSGDPLKKFTGLLSQAKVQQKDLAAERSAEMGRRAARIRTSTEGVSDPDEILRLTRQAQAGVMPARGLDIDMAEVTADDIMSIKGRVRDHFTNSGMLYDRGEALEGLNKVFMGEIPQKRQIELLQESLGPEFAGVLSRVSATGSLSHTMTQIAGIPRAVMSSFDLSMPFRQGALLSTRKEFWGEWKPMVKAFANEDYAREIDDLIQTDPFVGDMVRRGMHVPSYQGVKTLAGHEEAFMSDFASKYLPGVKMSERAAVTFLNKLRVDRAKSVVRKWERLGVQVTDEDLNSLAKYMNLATGRGDLPGMTEGNLPVLLNALFFSPRFITSRMQMLNPRTYSQMSPLVRKEAMRDMAAFIGLGTMGLSLLATAGAATGMNVSVETNPKSTDFGKLRVGNTRIDPWAGFQPIARYSAQFIAGEAKMSDGQKRQRDRDVTLENFGRSKLAPIPSYLYDAIKGETFTGQEVDTSTAAGVAQGFPSRVMPLFVQDMAEAIRAEGYAGALLTAPAAIGFGTQTYNSVAAIRDAGAREMFNGRPWAKLTGLEQAEVNTAFKEQLAKQEDTSSGIRQFIDNEDLKLRAKEQELLAGLGTTHNNRRFTEELQAAIRTRSDRIKAVIDFEATPGDQTVLDSYFGLRDMALVNGVVDYEKLDQLQNDFMGTLPADQQRIILERTGFQHIPELKWWSDARKTVADSGYYRQQGEALDMLEPLIQRIAPGVTTYRELTSAALTADDPVQAAVLAQVIKRVDRLTRTRQKVFRLKDPDTDRALTLLYGSTPILAQLRG